MPASSKPFALQSQYVPAILAARAQAGEPLDDADEDEDADEKPASSKSKATSKRKATPSNVQKDGMSQKKWNYSAIRKDFIQARKDEGCSYDDAVQLWDDSLDKAEYLAPVSVGELKKRRFLPAGSDKNPWYDKIHNSTK